MTSWNWILLGIMALVVGGGLAALWYVSVLGRMINDGLRAEEEYRVAMLRLALMQAPK